MYRKGEEYDRLDKLVLEIYVDYEISAFPLDEKTLCQKMGISLVPYSAYDVRDIELFKKHSLYGFYSPGENGYTPTIFYNDDVTDFNSPATIKQTIRHEIKHFLDMDVIDIPDDDDLAEHFGRYMACPTPYLVVNNITDINVIISTFNVSSDMARNASAAVVNRIKKYGNKIFEYEKPFMKLFGREID